MIVEVLSYPRYTKELLDEKITWHGKEYLDELKASGEGAVFMASHAGNWELLGAVLAMNGYPLISVAQEQNSKSADAFINEYRAMMKQHVTYKTGIRDMVRFLREGPLHRPAHRPGPGLCRHYGQALRHGYPDGGRNGQDGRPGQLPHRVDFHP